MQAPGSGDPHRSRQDEIDITIEQDTLTVSRSKNEGTDQSEGGEFLYLGIATRSFERRFQLADHVKVEGGSLENGLLHIEMVRELPEQMKPRKIEIGSDRLPEGAHNKKVKAA